MNLIKLAPFLIVLILFSCTTEDEVTSKKIKEKEEPSVFDVTTNTLKDINDLDEKFNRAEELLNREDSVLTKKYLNSISSVLFDSLSPNNLDTILIAMDLNTSFVIQNKYIGKTVVSYTSKIEEIKTKYLGLIMLNNITYHVVSEFSTVQLANTLKGNSFLYFYTKDKELKRSYNLEQPNNLPTSIQGNKLVFNIKGVEKSLTLDEELPIILCLPENLGCYE